MCCVCSMRSEEIKDRNKGRYFFVHKKVLVLVSLRDFTSNVNHVWIKVILALLLK